jgi:hypothetical protein
MIKDKLHKLTQEIFDEVLKMPHDKLTEECRTCKRHPLTKVIVCLINNGYFKRPEDNFNR